VVLNDIFQVLGLVIWSENQDYPLHRSNDLNSVEFFDIVLVYILDASNGMHQSQCCLVAHLLCSLSSVLRIASHELVVRFDVSLEAVCKLVEVLLLDRGVHPLRLQNDHILQVVATDRVARHSPLTRGVEAVLELFEAKHVVILQVVEQHGGQLHGRFEGFGVGEGASIQEHLHVLLLDVVSRDQGLLGRVLGEPDSLVDADESLQSVLPDSVVDINGSCEGLDVVLLRAIKVAHFKLKLESFQVVQVLFKVISLEQFEPKSLLLLDTWLSLDVLNGLVTIGIFDTKCFDKKFKLLLNSFQLSSIA